MEGETHRVVHVACPACHSSQTYYRIKTDDHFCRNCGKPFKGETPLFDLSSLSNQVEASNQGE